jgi:5'-nucleotidase (lipoprotein e(P4) family)
LDNSPFQARSIQNGTSYPVGWSEWVEESKATFIPGAQAFLATAKKLGVRVFYITNRKIKEAPATLKNLQALGVSVVNEDLLPKDKENGKGGRRNQVAQKHEIVMLIGDNLADFDDAFDMAPMAKRSEAVARFAKEWGSKWVVLPNPMYGDWESAMYEFNFSLKHEEKSALRHKNLRSLK